MHADVTTERFQDLVNHPVVFNFARRIITTGYLDCAAGYEGEMRSLLDEAFSRLSAAGPDPAGFQSAVAGLREQVFRKSDPDFWFNRLYKEYKRGYKPRRRAENLRPWLRGATLLDLGCGDGLTSLALEQAGFQPYLTDVLDYRDPAARGLPFRPMGAAGQAIPYPELHFDSGILLAVLHHVPEPDLRPLLGDLRRSVGRLIVEEDSYLVPPDLPGLEDILRQDPHLRDFLALSPEDQFRYLMFMDYFANAITLGIPEMDMPFNFRSVGEWVRLFTELGFAVVKVQVMGFQRGFFNRTCHVWFILD